MSPARIDDALASGKHERHFVEAGSVVFGPMQQSRGVYVLTRGLLAIRRRSSDGEAMIVRLTFPVEAFGLGEYFGSGQHAGEAVALTDATFCIVEGNKVEQWMAANPSLGAALTRRLAQDLGTAEEDILAMRRTSVQDRWLRLVDRLARHALAERRATVVEGRVVFPLPMSRQELAQVLGVRPETLSRLLRDCAAMGTVVVVGQTVHVDQGHLASQCDHDAAS